MAALEHAHMASLALANRPGEAETFGRNIHNLPKVKAPTGTQHLAAAATGARAVAALAAPASAYLQLPASAYLQPQQVLGCRSTSS